MDLSYGAFILTNSILFRHESSSTRRYKSVIGYPQGYVCKFESTIIGTLFVLTSPSSNIDL